MSGPRGLRYAEVIDGTITRHAVDLVGNNLTAELRWCVTHVEPVWVFNDGSFECRHETQVGWAPDGHEIGPFPWPPISDDLGKALADTSHVIEFRDDGWTIAHPLQERLDGSLFDCPLNWDADDPGVRGRFILGDDGTLDPWTEG